MNKIKLVSFAICPFVQRSVIALKEKGAEYEIEFIDLENKPEWFLQISPLGKVPVLLVENEVLFESAVINEYLDETIPPTLHPESPLRKAQNRSWIEFSSQCLNSFYNYALSQTETAGATLKQELTNSLNRFGKEIIGPWFNGNEFSLLECAVAPVFYRIKFLERKYKIHFSLDSRTREYAEMLLERKSVKDSVVQEFDDLSNSYFVRKNSFLTGLLQ